MPKKAKAMNFICSIKFIAFEIEFSKLSPNAYL
jgi:hypothetical protein